MKQEKTIHQHLILEALKNIKNEHQLLLIKNMVPLKLSQSDISLLNDIAYGDSAGVMIDYGDAKKSTSNFEKKRLELINAKSLKYGF
jgi:hypothetical protein